MEARPSSLTLAGSLIAGSGRPAALTSTPVMEGPGELLTRTGIIALSSLNQLPASFPKRLEAGPTATPHAGGTVDFVYLWNTIEQMNKYVFYVCDSGTTCALFKDKQGTG